MFDPLDFKTYTDEDLASHLNDVLNEQEKRARLARIPTQMAQLQAQFIREGGEPEAIAEALAAPLPVEQPYEAPESIADPVEPAEGDEAHE